MNCVAEVGRLIAADVRSGDRVIDATMGNGHDTLAMARAVGETGVVWAFDIQSEAVCRTADRLREAGLLGRCRLIQGCHTRMAIELPAQAAGCIRLILFNLGYLPGGDKAVTTRSATTHRALSCAFDLLAGEGRLIVTAYTGHPGGSDEARIVHRFFSTIASSGRATNVVCPETEPPKPCLFTATKIERHAGAPFGRACYLMQKSWHSVI